MKHMLTMPRASHGFALPTILIASVIMLTVLVATVTATRSVEVALNNQYYNQLARAAAESGLANADICLKYTNYSPTWTDSNPLHPDTDCTGINPNGASKWVVNKNNVRTTFSVGGAEVSPTGALRFQATGTVELTRSSNPNQAWRTYSATVAKNSRYNDAPQIAGGAGWKVSGHNGYMLASSGVLYGWGDNASYQIGDAALGLGNTVSTPTKIVMPSGVSKAKKVFNSGQGASILCIIATHDTSGDQAYCRGLGGIGGPTWTRFGLAAGLTAVDMSVNGYGSDGACVLASNSQVYCAGMNDAGQQGTATTSTAYVPVTAPGKFRLDLANPGPTSGSAASLTVQKVFHQDRFTCVIASDSRAYCAGDNNYGQLGQGTFTTNVWIGKSIPGRVVIPGNPAITDIRLSYHGALEGIFYQTINNDVYISGHNGQGTAADGAFTGSCPNGGAVNCYPTPGQITWGGFGRVISIGERGDDRHGICATAYGSVADSGFYCVGANDYGELGAGNCNDRATWFGPVNLGGERASYTTTSHSDYQMNSVMIITTAGNVYAAGDNTYGKLGTGGPLQACNGSFAKVQLPNGVKAVALANGDEYTSFILGDNGSVYAMGRNNNGQLGDGTTTDRSLPVQVKIPRQETVY